MPRISSICWSSLLWLSLLAPAWADITSNLILYWPLDTGSGSTATAGGGTSITGTIVGSPTWELATNCPGSLSRCLTLNGSSQGITETTALSSIITSTAGTFSLWIRPASTGPTGADVWHLSGIIADTSGDYLGLFHGNPASAGDGIWAFNWDGNADTIQATYTPATWFHIAWVHNATTLFLYKDGALVSSVASGTTGSLSGTMLLGRNNSFTWFGGRVDEVKAWSRALSAGDVLEEYQRSAAVTLPKRRPLWFSWLRAWVFPLWAHPAYREVWHAERKAH